MAQASPKTSIPTEPPLSTNGLVGWISQVDPAYVKEEPWLLPLARDAARDMLKHRPLEALLFARAAGDFALQAENAAIKLEVAKEITGHVKTVAETGIFLKDNAIDDRADDIARESFEVLIAAARNVEDDKTTETAITAVWEKISEALLATKRGEKSYIVLNAAQHVKEEIRKNTMLTRLASRYIDRLDV